jgi:hypothetical protein
MACAEREPSDARLATMIDTIGDTVRVRTGPGAAPVIRLEPEVRIANVEGNAAYELGRIAAMVEGPAGGIYLWDARLDELRLYDSSGVFVRTLGRRGKGPGEYVDASGIAPAPGGDVAIWDPQTGRFTVFTPEGTVRTSWRWQSSLIFEPHVLPTDSAQRIYVPTLMMPAASESPDNAGFAHVRLRPDGRVVDTLVLPAEGPTPMLRAERAGTSTGSALPFAAGRVWVITPMGTIASSHAKRYAIDIARTDSTVLRIERQIDAIPVGDDERRDLADEITRDMRKVDPTWRWSGPDIPRTKPHIKALMFADDGRLWVNRSVRAERHPPADTTRGAPSQWIEPATYDVFERDGRLLGEITIPAGTKVHLLLGERLWAVQSDSLDVPSIMRYRLITPR